MLTEINDALTLAINANLTLMAFCAFVILAMATEVGFQIARYRATQIARYRATRRNIDERVISSTATLTGGMLALVAFVLGLTISVAQNRYETRRQEVVEEANTIGTAWLRAKMVGGEQGDAVAALIEDYTKVRIAYTSAEEDGPIRALVNQTSALQNQMWKLATQTARAAPNPMVTSYFASLNDMFDASLSQRYAFASRVPSTVIWMLMGGSMLSLGAMGYQFGLAGTRQNALTALLLAMWVGSMMVIIDFSRPRAGLLRVDTRPLEWTLQGFSPTPPPP